MQERTFVPWFDTWVAVRADGRAAIDAGEILIPADNQLRRHDCDEYAGWMRRLRRDPEAARRDAYPFYWTSVPDVPRHWPTPNWFDHLDQRRDFDQDRPADYPVGNVSAFPGWALTQLAVAELFPERVLEALLASETAGNSWAGLMSWTAVEPGLVMAELSPLVALHAGRHLSASLMTESLWRDHPLTQIEAALVDAHRGGGRSRQTIFDSYTRRGRLDDAARIAEAHPEVVAAGVRALLAYADDVHTSFLFSRLDDEPVLAALRREAERQGAPAAARGMYAEFVDGGDPSRSVAAWRVDGRLHRVPQPLAAPTSTRLRDTTLEGTIRNRCDAAVASLQPDGMSDEVMVTGALLGALTATLSAPMPAPPPGSAGFNLAVTAQNSRTDEKVFGADLGIIVEVNISDRIKTKTGHLVQVKQSRSLKGGEPLWVIARQQLEDIRSHDPTATYWLLHVGRDPGVMAVPAKVLRAIGIIRPGEKTFTVRYSEVRDAAVPLGQELVDLTLGLWIGSDDVTAVDTAEGRNAGHVPRRVLTVILTPQG